MGIFPIDVLSPQRLKKCLCLSQETLLSQLIINKDHSLTKGSIERKSAGFKDLSNQYIGG